jgi:AraC-like DNA-binding protein
MQLSKLDETIEKIFIDITVNYREPFLIAALCEKYNISEHRLKRDFKNIFDITPNKYRLCLCMDEAVKELLKGVKINELANRYGYNSVGNFTKAFKKVYPNGPSWYIFLSSHQLSGNS